MLIRVRLSPRVGFQKFLSEYMHIKSVEFFLYIYLEPRKPGKQTFCNFSQLPLSNGLFTELFAYVVFFVRFVLRALCRCGCRQNFANFYLPPPPSLHHHHHHHFYLYRVKTSGKYKISLPLFFFSSYPQFSLKHKWQLFEIGARLTLASVPFSSLHFVIGHLEKSFPESFL